MWGVIVLILVVALLWPGGQTIYIRRLGADERRRNDRSALAAIALVASILLFIACLVLKSNGII